MAPRVERAKASAEPPPPWGGRGGHHEPPGGGSVARRKKQAAKRARDARVKRFRAAGAVTAPAKAVKRAAQEPLQCRVGGGAT
jgi:hypothetical protein